MAREGMGLLERKRDSLMGRAMDELEASKRLRLEVTEAWRQLQEAWEEVYGEEDIGRLRSLAQAFVFSPQTAGERRMWMSATLNDYRYEKTKLPFLGSSLDCSLRTERVRGMLHALMPKMIGLMNRESSVRSMIVALRQCQRQVNALDEVIIPGFQDEQRRIAQQLEERERETLFQIKRLKEAEA